MALTPRTLLLTTVLAVATVGLAQLDYASFSVSATPSATEAGVWSLAYAGEQRTADEIIDAHGGLYPDASLQAYLREVGERMADTTPAQYAPQYFSFYLTADTTAQVIGLRSGEILVSIGFLQMLKSEDALAQVLAGQVVQVMTAGGTVCRLARPDGTCYAPSDLVHLVMNEAGYTMTQAQVVRA